MCGAKLLGVKDSSDSGNLSLLKLKSMPSLTKRYLRALLFQQLTLTPANPSHSHLAFPSFGTVELKTVMVVQ